MWSGERRGARVALCVAVAVVACAAGSSARASIILSDFNSTIVFDQDMSGDITGMSNWVVDGVDQLALQWFWFRVGPAGPELPLHALDQTINAQAGRFLDVTYADPGGAFAIDLVFRLQGGTVGSQLSDLAEQIRVRNTGQSDLDFHLFQYTDFDICGTASDDTVLLDGYKKASVFGSQDTFAETVLTPAASRREAGIYSATLNKLNDGDADSLSNAAGPLANVNATWALQWDRKLAPGGSFLISENTTIQVPEPTTLFLLTLGGVAMGWRRRRAA